MAPHLIWLVQNDFLPFNYAEARATPSSGLLDHLRNPAEYVTAQAFFLIPSLIIAAPLFWRSGKSVPSGSADAFDRRIVTLLVFGPALTLLALSLVTGRGTQAMWGFPLWLFLGLWFVLFARAALDHTRLSADRRAVGRGVCALGRGFRRRLSGAAEFRPPLPRRVFSRRPVVGR